MIEIAVETVDQALTMVSELRRAGLVANQDFTWSFMPRADQIWGGPLESHHVIFEFQDTSLETFYKMKWL